VIRLYEIPFSTNVERVTLALAHKGIGVEQVTVDPADRSPVRDVSGQELVPVLVDDGRVVSDSTSILEYLEQRYPDPPLYPRNEARRAEVGVFVDWFNRVWKFAPNEIERRLAAGDRDVEALAAELRDSRDLFEGLLAGREYLFGEFSVADCIAFPFLKYAVLRDDADDELFHEILVDHLRLEGAHPRLEAWIRRVDERPRV
jgi:glutathione S-transferase